MAHLLLLRLQIASIVIGRGHLDGNPLDDLETEFRKLIDLIRVVRQKAHGFHPEIAEDLRAYEVLALVAGKSKRKVGL